MIFYLIGIDYRRASLRVRESLWSQQDRIAAFWRKAAPEKTVVLLTCNRLEIYGVADNFFEAARHSKAFQGFLAPWGPQASVLYGRRAVFRHALRLACGLESQFKGEAQIIEQLSAWFKKSVFPSPLFGFWGEILSLARNIRLQGGLVENSESIASFAFKELSSVRDIREDADVAVIGTGRIAELCVEVKPERVRLTFISRKRHSKARQLARRAGTPVKDLKDIPEVLRKVDALFSATASPHYTLKVGDVREAVAHRTSPLYLYDFALPRDIDPAVAAITGVVLKNIEDLGRLFEERGRGQRSRFFLLEFLVEEALRRCLTKSPDEGCVSVPGQARWH